jgi:hypothetical protein
MRRVLPLFLLLLLSGCLPSPGAVNRDIQSLRALARRAAKAHLERGCHAIGTPTASTTASTACDSLRDCLHLDSDAIHAGQYLVHEIASEPDDSSIEVVSSNPVALATAAASTLASATTEQLTEAQAGKLFQQRRDIAILQCASAGVR